TRLLVVDDEPLVVAMLVDLLSEGPFTIETATDGYEALVKVGTFRPAIIVLDAVMPGLDGIEACRCLRRLPETRDIRILGVTGHPSVIPVLRGAGAGFGGSGGAGPTHASPSHWIRPSSCASSSASLRRTEPTPSRAERHGLHPRALCGRQPRRPGPDASSPRASRTAHQADRRR